MAWKDVQYENGKFRTGSGGGGASSLADLTDTAIISPTDGQVLKYDGTTQKWQNANEGGGGGGGNANIIFGNSIPTPQQGNDGDVYIKYLSGVGLTALFGKISGAWESLNLFAEYMWDFTKSLMSINNGTEAIVRNAQQTASGIVFNSQSSYIQLPSTLIKRGYTFEIKIDSLSISSAGNNNRVFIFNSDSGFVWRGATGKWGVWDSGNGWQESTITTPNYFDNSVLKIVIDSNYKWHIYKDNSLVFEPPNALTSYFNQNAPLTIGSSGGNSCYNMTVSAINACPNNV